MLFSSSSSSSSSPSSSPESPESPSLPLLYFYHICLSSSSSPTTTPSPCPSSPPPPPNPPPPPHTNITKITSAFSSSSSSSSSGSCDSSPLFSFGSFLQFLICHIWGLSTTGKKKSLLSLRISHRCRSCHPLHDANGCCRSWWGYFEIFGSTESIPVSITKQSLVFFEGQVKEWGRTKVGVGGGGGKFQLFRDVVEIQVPGVGVIGVPEIGGGGGGGVLLGRQRQRQSRRRERRERERGQGGGQNVKKRLATRQEMEMMISEISESRSFGGIELCVKAETETEGENDEEEKEGPEPIVIIAKIRQIEEFEEVLFGRIIRGLVEEGRKDILLPGRLYLMDCWHTFGIDGIRTKDITQEVIQQALRNCERRIDVNDVQDIAISEDGTASFVVSRRETYEKIRRRARSGDHLELKPYGRFPLLETPVRHLYFHTEDAVEDSMFEDFFQKRIVDDGFGNDVRLSRLGTESRRLFMVTVTGNPPPERVDEVFDKLVTGLRSSHVSAKCTREFLVSSFDRQWYSRQMPRSGIAILGLDNPLFHADFDPDEWPANEKGFRTVFLHSVGVVLREEYRANDRREKVCHPTVSLYPPRERSATRRVEEVQICFESRWDAVEAAVRVTKDDFAKPLFVLPGLDRNQEQLKQFGASAAAGELDELLRRSNFARAAFPRVFDPQLAPLPPTKLWHSLHVQEVLIFRGSAEAKYRMSAPPACIGVAVLPPPVLVATSSSSMNLEDVLGRRLSAVFNLALVHQYDTLVFGKGCCAEMPGCRPRVIAIAFRNFVEQYQQSFSKIVFAFPGDAVLEATFKSILEIERPSRSPMPRGPGRWFSSDLSSATLDVPTVRRRCPVWNCCIDTRSDHLRQFRHPYKVRCDADEICPHALRFWLVGKDKVNEGSLQHMMSYTHKCAFGRSCLSRKIPGHPCDHQIHDGNLPDCLVPNCPDYSTQHRKHIVHPLAPMYREKCPRGTTCPQWVTWLTYLRAKDHGKMTADSAKDQRKHLKLFRHDEG